MYVKCLNVHLFLQLEEGVEDAEVELLHEGVDVEPDLVLEELVLQGLFAWVSAGTLEALLVLAVVLRHLPHLCKSKGHISSKQLWFLSKIEQGVKFT